MFELLIDIKTFKISLYQIQLQVAEQLYIEKHKPWE